ncbi:MAG: DNA translocase FtsK 4TM domain-containing protein [Armatimonadota bacterium]|jgi:S-DNA-T family DNA segregation ATPase FtsK/SpoIIIE|nr:DNA translocase FtsK 4TM domain-containing protein [Fimbriimonadaceae bacterium]
MAPAAPAPSPRSIDAWGLGMVGGGVIVGIALGLGSSGILGDTLAGGLRVMLGPVAWVVPALLVIGGIRLILGKTHVAHPRLAWGLGILLVGVTGLMARPIQGDYFDPEATTTTGGYVGAIGGWMFSTLFGQGGTVALVTLCLIGLLLVVDLPVRDLLTRKGQDADEESEDAEPIETPRRRRTAELPIETTARPRRPIPEAMDEEEEAPRPSRARRPVPAPQDAEALPKLADEAPMPKEGYVLPSMGLLTEPSAKAKRDPKEVQRNIEVLESTLEQFGVDAQVMEVATGPTVTRYELGVGPGIRVNRVTNLSDNLAMSLAAPSIRVEAPIPGKNAIGIEVPNKNRQPVTLREMCESLEFHDQEKKLLVALGKDVAGAPLYADLTRMPHMLVGGATNSGKSIGLATLIMSLILRNTPKDCRLVLIDPKQVELSLFDGLPHLMCPVVTDVKEAAGVLRALVREMERRYLQFKEAGVRNIDGWNEKAPTYQDRLPYIVLVIDELADLMMQVANEVEASICRLGQLARATGIHMVIATQRPSVDVITGLIKANIPSRIAFAVSSAIDSRTILDSSGAEDLIGRGDMLFRPIGAHKPMRIQGCYVSESEISAVCRHWREQEGPRYVLEPIAVAEGGSERGGEAGGGGGMDDDPLWAEAVTWVVERNAASTSMLQRKFRVGFQRASRLLDAMEERGIVGPKDGSRPREILVDEVQVQAMLGNDEYMTPMPDDAMFRDDEEDLT